MPKRKPPVTQVLKNLKPTDTISVQFRLSQTLYKELARYANRITTVNSSPTAPLAAKKVVEEFLIGQLEKPRKKSA